MIHDMLNNVGKCKNKAVLVDGTLYNNNNLNTPARGEPIGYSKWNSFQKQADPYHLVLPQPQISSFTCHSTNLGRPIVPLVNSYFELAA
jgi:hypothetical protein